MESSGEPRKLSSIAARSLFATQNRALEMLLEGGTLSEVLGVLLRSIEATSDDEMLTSILLLSEDGRRLTHCAAPNLPSDYTKAIDGLPVGPCEGSCGTAAFLGKPVIVEDIASDPLWVPYRDLALGCSLRACWSTPLLSREGKTLGTFAMYYRAPHRPSPLDSAVVDMVTRTAVIAMERTRHISQLRESEERFRALSLSCPVGIFMANGAGDIIFMNPRCQEICGFDVMEGKARGWVRFVHPHDLKRVLREWEAALREQREYEADVRWLHASGEVKWSIVRAAPVRSDSGVVLGYVGSVVDRTHRIAAEQQAKALAGEIAAIVRASPVGIISFDLDRKVRAWNPMAERILGWREDEIIGRPLPVPESTRERWLALTQAVMRGESLTNLQSKCLRKDGSEVDVLVSGSAVLDDSGQPLGSVGIIVDASELISAKSRLEASVTALRESESRLRTLADNIAQLAWMADEKGWIFWYNKRWFDYTGTTLEEVKGWGWLKVHHPDHVERVVARIQRSWDTGEPWEDTFPLRASDGTYAWFLSRALPIRDEGGRVVLWFGTNTDITQLREAEEALLRAEGVAATGRMAHAMAHEINNPLEAITNLLYLLDLDHSLSETSRKRVAAAASQLARVSRITKQTLSLYGHARVPQSTNLCLLLDNIIDTFSQPLAAKQILINRRYDWNGEIELLQNDMRQVLWNLLDNSIEAVQVGGRIVIHVCAVSGHAHELRKGIRITIADNGVGFRTEDKIRIFEPFFSTKTQKGAGLGLWVVQNIVNRHRGTIRVRSTTRQGRSGTCFTVFLPLEAATTRGQAA